MKTKGSLYALLFACAFLLMGFLPSQADAAMFLKDRLRTAEVGDYIVTGIDNNYTVLVVKDKNEFEMTIEEITVPFKRIKHPKMQWHGWRNWVECGAPGHTCWVMYSIHSPTGKMKSYYSYTKQGWGRPSEADNFLTKLFNLRMVPLREEDMKKIGPAPEKGVKDSRRNWAPRMFYEGREIQGVAFEGWKTRWPKDGSELSGKTITIFTPKDERRYPAYFPYWLEVKEMFGKARVRIIDSGKNLRTPRSTMTVSP